MPTGWATMTSTDLPVTDYDVAITHLTKTATFVFRVRLQPASTRPIVTLGAAYERFSIAFQVTDATDHATAGSPRLIFGSDFGTALTKALRLLVANGLSMIPRPGTLVNFGAIVDSIIDSVEISQQQENTPDVFVITCSAKEQAGTSAYVSSESAPKLAISDEVPPWQMPADVVFDCQTTEGMTLGFAYTTTDLDGTKTYTVDDLRKNSIAKESKMVPVEDYAKSPFSSPPAFPKVNGTLKVSKAYLRGGGAIDLSSLQGVVNDKPIRINIEGSQLIFPEGTLSPVMLQVSPKLFKLPIPWYNKTKHPLNKTNGQLYYGYSRTAANKVAVNHSGQTIMIHKPLRYIEASASFTYRPEGFGVWLANRGYAEVDEKAADKLTPIVNDHGIMKEMWLDKKGKKSKEARIWRGFTMVKSSSAVEKLLKEFFPTNSDFKWASAGDKFGGKVK